VINIEDPWTVKVGKKLVAKKRKK